jgi:hypothetical protein
MIKDGTCVCKNGPDASGCPAAIVEANLSTNIVDGATKTCSGIHQHVVYDLKKGIYSCRYNLISALTSCAAGKLIVSDYFTETPVVNCDICKDASLRLVDFDYTRATAHGICLTKAECEAGTATEVSTTIDYTAPSDSFINTKYDSGLCRCKDMTDTLTAYGCIAVTDVPCDSATPVRFHGTCIAITATIPANSTLLHDSANTTHCVCSPGFKFDGTDACVANTFISRRNLRVAPDGNNAFKYDLSGEVRAKCSTDNCDVCFDGTNCDVCAPTYFSADKTTCIELATTKSICAG